MPAVLFVCTANRFRSPLAEAAFKKCLEENGSPMGWDIKSAGTWTAWGLPPYPSALKAAKKIGLKIGSHRTRPITSELLSKSNLVIVMQASQREAIQIEFPEAARKTLLLSEIIEGISYDIPDPILTMEVSHQEVAEDLCGLVTRGYKKICDLALKYEVS